MKRKSKSEWQEIIRNYRVSGMPLREWCEIKNINVHTFRKQLSNFRRCSNADRCETKEVQLVKWLPVVQTEANTDSNSETNSSIQVQIGSFKILVKSGFDESVLSGVCKALMQIC